MAARALSSPKVYLRAAQLREGFRGACPLSRATVLGTRRAVKRSYSDATSSPPPPRPPSPPSTATETAAAAAAGQGGWVALARETLYGTLMSDLKWAMKRRDVKSVMSYVNNKRQGYPPEAEAVVVDFLIKQKAWWGVSELMNNRDFPLGIESYRALAQAFVCPERWWQGLSLIRGMHLRRTVYPTDSMYRQVADALVEGGGLEEGWSFMRQCLRPNQRVPPFIFLRRFINAYAEMGRVDLCERMRWESRHAYTAAESRTMLLNHSLKACVRAGEADRAFALLQSELKGGPAAEACVDKVSWNTVLTACAKAARVDLATRVKRLMIEKKCPMDIRILTSLLEVYAVVGDVEAAKRVFYHDLPRNQCRPTVYCYAALIKAYGNAEDAEGVLKGLAELRAAGLQPNTVVYALAIIGCGRGGRLEEAKALYAEALKRIPERVDGDRRAIHYAILNAYSRWGKADEATALVKKLEAKKVDLEVRSYNALLGACLAAQRYTQCLEVVRHLRSLGKRPDEMTCQLLLDAAVRGEGVLMAEALQVVEDVLCNEAKHKKDNKGEAPVREGKPLWGHLLSLCRSRDRLPLAEAIFHALVKAKHEQLPRLRDLLMVIFGNGGLLEAGLYAHMLPEPSSPAPRPKKDEDEGEAQRLRFAPMTSLILGAGSSGAWPVGLYLFEHMASKGCRDRVMASAALQCLDRADPLVLKLFAPPLFRWAHAEGLYPTFDEKPGELDLHAMCGAEAKVVVLHYLGLDGGAHPPLGERDRVTVVVGHGKALPHVVKGEPVLRHEVSNVLRGTPFVLKHLNNPGRVLIVRKGAKAAKKAVAESAREEGEEGEEGQEERHASSVQ